MNVSRRKLAKILTTATLASQVTQAQTPPAAPAKPAADQDLVQAKAGLRANAAQVARIPLPMAVEPAFRFKA